MLWHTCNPSVHQLRHAVQDLTLLALVPPFTHPQETVTTLIIELEKKELSVCSLVLSSLHVGISLLAESRCPWLHQDLNLTKAKTSRKALTLQLSLQLGV